MRVDHGAEDASVSNNRIEPDKKSYVSDNAFSSKCVCDLSFSMPLLPYNFLERRLEKGFFWVSGPECGSALSGVVAIILKTPQTYDSSHLSSSRR